MKVPFLQEILQRIENIHCPSCQTHIDKSHVEIISFQNKKITLCHHCNQCQKDAFITAEIERTTKKPIPYTTKKDTSTAKDISDHLRSFRGKDIRQLFEG